MSKIVEQFQYKYGLTQDGIIGPKTCDAMRELFGGVTKSQLAHFLGQSHVETGGFRFAEENLNYSPGRLLEVFPKYFTRHMAESYGYNPEKIANVVYANRMGNGDDCTGDGYRYRGRGCMQITGRSMYKQIALLADDMRIFINPDIVTRELFWRSGVEYFTNRSIWFYSENTSETAIRYVTLKVNGGYTALNDRSKWTKHYRRIQG